MPENTTWIYYRVFLRNPDDFSDLVCVLKDVVGPVVEEFASSILHFHYFFYRGVYGNHLEGGEGVIEMITESNDDYVGFIRLRLQVTQSSAEKLDIELNKKCKETSAVIGYEQPRKPYDPVTDLGERFGVSRVPLVMDFLEAAARLALTLVEDDQSLDQQDISSGLIHLAAKSLQYRLRTFV